MDRKEFLRTCTAGLCGCVAAYALPPAQAAAGSSPGGAGKSLFINQRYAKLLEILQGRMKEDELAGCLRELGSFCSTMFPAVEKYRGNVSGFIEELKATKTAGKTVDVTYDADRRVYTMVSDYDGECPCPLNGRSANTPSVACNCSLGWHKKTWKTVLEKDVRVETIETALRGGKRCIFAIHVLS